MKHLIYPCIWFNGNAKEAADYYCLAFPDAEVKVCTPVVVTFHIHGKQFMGLNGGPDYKPNPSISFFTICETAEEIDQAWKILTEGGNIMMPLNSYPWSNKYGWVQDKYGVSWQLSLGMPGEQQQRDIFPSLMFTGEQNGKAEKAISFYTSLFENSSTEIMARYEAGEHDTAGNIKYGQFKINDYRISAMDSSGPHHFGFDQGVSLVVNCDTQAEIDFFWLNLTEGGKEAMCGWCQDAFGVWWQIVPSILGSLMTDPEKAPKVMNAFMKMKKFDIEELKKAAE
ncbi:putative 3-demethylubiquinone-9 3-methyltransferase (glyoxalase superfamily) [Pedobacter cryoconitis]|uniref:Putative 3-demethylubiquinone-9 3-methyltransferase (Glyoxalase superfamily) n=1 Tax=Pedobacter cryoconitis TaxID=188932 RepID=A0A7W8ZPU1_9SPHI|nr:VOC family protein [Pedobacter cryoconitis]MBB5637979.1 putative 3-demethylubiquinone-9 3-methyltransferase (glyoxalase superfamily) [Pedobacter cryoconitis]